MKKVPLISRMKWFGAGLMLVLGGCATAPLSGPEPANLVSDQGIGPIKLGMTAAQAQVALGAGYRVVSPVKGNTVQLAGWHRVLNVNEVEVFRFFVSDWQNPEVASPIIRVRTTRPEYRTVEGVGPGVSLVAASEKWGAPLLRRNTAGLGVEQLTFHGQPNFLIFEGRSSAGYAGIYPRLRSGALNPEELTKEFWPESRIYAVMVVQTKPFPNPAPRPAPTPTPFPTPPSAFAAPPPVKFPDPLPTPSPSMRTRVSAE